MFYGLHFHKGNTYEEMGLSLVIEAASGLFCKLRQAIRTREYCKYVCPHTLCSEKEKRRNVLDRTALRGGPRLHRREEVEGDRNPYPKRYPFLLHPALVSEHEPQ